MALESDRIDLSGPLKEICRKLDVPYGYMREITIRPLDTTVVLFQGEEGRGRGSKFLGDDGKPALETLEFRTR